MLLRQPSKCTKPLPFLLMACGKWFVSDACRCFAFLFLAALELLQAAVARHLNGVGISCEHDFVTKQVQRLLSCALVCEGREAMRLSQHARFSAASGPPQMWSEASTSQDIKVAEMMPFSAASVFFFKALQHL